MFLGLKEMYSMMSGFWRRILACSFNVIFLWASRRNFMVLVCHSIIYGWECHTHCGVKRLVSLHLIFSVAKHFPLSHQHHSKVSDLLLLNLFLKMRVIKWIQSLLINKVFWGFYHRYVVKTITFHDWLNPSKLLRCLIILLGLHSLWTIMWDPWYF